MKGIILAGGAGSRLYPASLPISKILLPVYDKPMIYYPITTLLLAGIRDILIITNALDIQNFEKVLGTGEQIGVKFSYRVQDVPRGIADSFLIAEDFINNEPCALILGDNIFHGFGFSSMLKKVGQKTQGATVFGYAVNDPHRFGVVEFDDNNRALSIEEKPQNPRSNYAVTGLYFYDKNVVEYAKTLKPSQRGELEITDLNNIYLKNRQLDVEILGRGFAWLDTGTFESLLQAGNFIKSMEVNTGMKIACIEEVAWRMGYISTQDLSSLAKKYNNGYGEYIEKIIKTNTNKLDRNAVV
ncbi:TPA: glucose-1-phosphate thymidylyltransferase RfbA [Candidatus Galligastranaerophilus intestinavium]|uniref:Glucose-1-phosphate thymidylyltransferase n=1 Tax=Candidatus Galligastranaerophilus intestinavium TaxID=2840836 RepID=A0A9D1FJK1_9BACT|nr:glucose-1-phosphate thymidylyltransferase RfbA [Candidatus Galligastranaerophilus intestinavium]